MKSLLVALALCSVEISSHAVDRQQHTKPAKAAASRRTFMETMVGLTGATATVRSTSPANALSDCKSKSMNCVRTSWTPPRGTSKADAMKTLREVIESYPQSGQNGIDCNGWTIANDVLELAGGPASARVEYRSCVGVAAMSINLGQPFVDDLLLEVDDNGVVEVKSSSRVGGTDAGGVNKKRIDYLAKVLKAQGWTVVPAKYNVDWYVGNTM